MTDVIGLKPGQALPDREVSVLVGPAEDGSGMETARSWTYFSYLPNVPGAREARIAEAKSYAEEQGIRCVYVIEAGLADQVAGGDTSVVMPLKVEADTG
jgi:hypothetical protein